LGWLASCLNNGQQLVHIKKIPNTCTRIIKALTWTLFWTSFQLRFTMTSVGYNKSEQACTLWLGTAIVSTVTQSQYHQYQQDNREPTLPW